MASFSLQSQRTGRYKEFTLIEILKLLGDTVNDEIWLEDGEDVYNLSSFRELNGGNGNGGATENWSVEIPNDIAGQSTFYFQHLPLQPQRAMVILNGMNLTQNKDYTLNGREVQCAYRLNSQDTLKFVYPY